MTKDKVVFRWTQECDTALRRLKARLCSNPILSYPKKQGLFILDTNASRTGIGAILSQVQDLQEHAMEYYSRVLSKPKQNYSVTRKELLAIVKAVDYFYEYLYGRKFLIRTDHAAQ